MFNGRGILNFRRCTFAALIFVALMIAILPTHSVFANEESDKHYQQGQKFFSDKKYAEAITEFQSAIAIDPNNASYHNDLGRAYNRTENYEDAVREYNEALRINPNKVAYYNNLGWTYLNWEKYAPAEENFKKAIEKNANEFSYAYRGLASVYRAQGRNAEAKNYFCESVNHFIDTNASVDDVLTDLNDAIKLDDKDALLFNARGKIYLNSEKYDEAFNDFDKAIQLNGSLFDAYEGRAVIYIKRGNIDEAKKNFYVAGNVCINIGNHDDEAQVFYEKAIELDAQYADAYFGAGQIETRRNNHTKAIELFDKAIDLGLNQDYVYDLRGYSNYKLENFTDAIKDFDKALSLDKTHANAYKNRGETYFSMNEFGKAQSDFEQYLKLDGKNLDDNSRKYFEDKIQQCIDLQNKLYNDAYENYQRKKYAEAIADFDKVIENSVDFALAYRWRGEAHYALKNFEQSSEDFKKYLQLDKELDDETRAEYVQKAKITNLFDWACETSGIGEANELLKVLFIVMGLEYAIIIGCGIRDGNLTLGLAARELVIKIILLVIVIVANALGNLNMLSGLEIRNVVIAILTLYVFIYGIKKADRLGLPVPEWLKELSDKIIDIIEGWISRLTGQASR